MSYSVYTHRADSRSTPDLHSCHNCQSGTQAIATPSLSQRYYNKSYLLIAVCNYSWLLSMSLILIRVMDYLIFRYWALITLPKVTAIVIQYTVQASPPTTSPQIDWLNGWLEFLNNYLETLASTAGSKVPFQNFLPFSLVTVSSRMN